MRKNISLNEATIQRSKILAASRALSGLSQLVAVLINEEWDRRGGGAVLKEAGEDYKISSPPGHIAGIPPAAAGAPVIMPPNLQEEGASAHAPDAPGGSTPRVHARKNPPPERRKKK